MSPPALRPGYPLAWRAGSVLLAGGGLYATYSLFAQRAHAEAPEAQAPAPAPTPRPVFSRFGPTTLRVQAVQEVNHNTKKLVLAYPDPEARSGLQPISSLITLTHPPGRWLPLPRPYTPISDLDEKGHLTLLIKKYPHGRASSYLHALQPGDSLTVLTARRGYQHSKPNQFSHVYLLAGGAGITPCYQLIRTILQDPAETTKLTLLFGGNTEADLVLREELEAFVRRFPERLRVVYTVSRGREGKGEVREGRIDEALLRENLLNNEGRVKVFVSGPPGMEKALIGGKGEEGVLQKLGFGREQIHQF
ncbi:ferredoxin reductase-like protein [Aspergillus japonicus CBS 114.51]|uniref:NADH-cytochrome b5 reductase n=2 Tax=Aspergillus TaxID=5052 RepID=A0A2V5HX28_ASPV1|nr:ferredoxin reductase-like protein [Aspergillus japonicus CBS 114.51]PYI16447.1 ferredoxin reductase-like protein [Aspergillus violaceofuscus CBS 115571]RAH78049.1 ferredoxin reductase-like protein [Aspergillus japonicus CBS 114.51]